MKTYSNEDIFMNEEVENNITDLYSVFEVQKN